MMSLRMSGKSIPGVPSVLTRPISSFSPVAGPSSVPVVPVVAVFAVSVPPVPSVVVSAVVADVADEAGALVLSLLHAEPSRAITARPAPNVKRVIDRRPTMRSAVFMMVPPNISNIGAAEVCLPAPQSVGVTVLISALSNGGPSRRPTRRPSCRESQMECAAGVPMRWARCSSWRRRG